MLKSVAADNPLEEATSWRTTTRFQARAIKTTGIIMVAVGKIARPSKTNAATMNGSDVSIACNRKADL